MAIAVFVAWRILGNSIADSAAARSPETALAWRESHPGALLALAQRDLDPASSPADWRAAADLALKALIKRPLDPVALRLLAIATDVAGDAEKADRLMQLAARRNLRDPAAHLWQFDRAVERSRFAVALQHADMVIRSSPSLRDQLLPVLISFVTDPDAFSALVDFLGSNPPWRDWFLNEISRKTEDQVLLSRLYLALNGTPNPPDPSELRAHLQALIKAGRFVSAYLIWAELEASDTDGVRPYLLNGDFEEPISGLPFDWVIEKVAGADARLVSSGEGKALRIDFANARVGFRHVRKLLLLPPGQYEMTGRVAADDLRSQRGFHWRVVCADPDRTELGSSPRFSGQLPWQTFGFDFTVPASGCRAQWLVLEHAARVAVEQQVRGGTLWMDDLALTRLAPSS